MEQERRYCTILIKRRVSGEPRPPPMLRAGELAVNGFCGYFFDFLCVFIKYMLYVEKH